MISGLKSAIALICIGAAVGQCVELFINFQTHATMWTKDTKLELEDMPTPSIIFCNDPPNLHPDHEIVYQSPDIKQSASIHSIVQFKTVLKVGIHSSSFKCNKMDEVDDIFLLQGECNIMESFRIKSQGDKRVYLCYKNSTKINIYSVVPGKYKRVHET